MNDFTNLEKVIVREFSCRLCLCTDIIKLKPLSAELKRKIKKLLNITIRTDDNLPKAICHDCLQQVGTLYLYAVKVEKNQKFLSYHEMKNSDIKPSQSPKTDKLHPIISTLPGQETNMKQNDKIIKGADTKLQQGDVKNIRNKSPSAIKYLEAMPLEEFANTESVDKSLLNSSQANTDINITKDKRPKKDCAEEIDQLVIIDGKPAKQGIELDKQITLFYKMECLICHAPGFHFRSLMKHYKDGHGVPGYVTCCDKKFHYFYPKKIIEHMAYHLQPNIFMCSSCHHNFQTSQDLTEHQSNGGRSDGKIICPRCPERYPTYHELGFHIITHRSDTLQCDYCGKTLKHHHRKKTINHLEDVILCTHCVRVLKNIGKQEKELKEKIKPKNHDTNAFHKNHKFHEAMDLSAEEISTE